MDDLTARYEAWREARIRLNWREDIGEMPGDRPSSSEWERSDDEANALLAEFADAWAELRTFTFSVPDPDGIDTGWAEVGVTVQGDLLDVAFRYHPSDMWGPPTRIQPT